MKPLTIEINGTGTHNRGAELMAIAVGQRIRATFPDARIVVSSCFGNPEETAKYGFHRTWEYRGLVVGRIKSAISAATRGIRPGLLDPKEVDIVLDASGFAFSDQWGERRAIRETQALLHPRRHHQALIMLPQAFGPFENPGVSRECSRLFERALLVCARDSQSFASVSSLGFERKLRQYPDFTVGVSPMEAKVAIPENYVAIVPNYRMLDKGGDAGAYLDFLRQIIGLTRQHGLNLAFVLHDANEDRKVIGQLGGDAGSIPVLTDSDPRVLKGMLGRAKFVVGSRFHALVSSLSQGVPCVGAGWSHKYPELFRDFACPELLMPRLNDTAALESTLRMLCDESQRTSIAGRIKEASLRIKASTELMWEEVESLIRQVQAARPECRAS
jgi:Uncharacterized conserved protein